MLDLEAERASPVALNFSAESQCLLVAFSGLQLNVQVPRFEWMGALSGAPAKQVFVRDPYRRWYLRGLPGIAGSPAAVASYLAAVIHNEKCRRIVTVGSSMGGFAALLFGCLLEADEVIAIAPQVKLPSRQGPNLIRTIAHGNWRMLWNQRQLLLDKKVDRRYFNLRSLLEISNAPTNYHVYYSREYAVDMAHIRHLEGLRSVILHERSGEGHNIGYAMRDSGELATILKNVITGQTR